MSYQVSATDLSRIRISEPDPVKNILQNIACILATPKGSVPCYREFGIDTSFLDRPINVAKALVSISVKEAIEAFEPRAEYIQTTFSVDESNPGSLIPTVEVNIKNG